MNRDIVIFVGPPGSGKGSLSQLCIEKLGWQQLSTGNLCRDHIARNTDIGKQIDFLIKSGKLISDSLILAMVKEWLAENDAKQSTSVIFDGFPRVVSQAQSLQELLGGFSDIRLSLVRLVLSDDQVMHRLLGRSICQNNRCQRVYSFHSHSAHKPLKAMTCNECGSPLIKRLDDEAEAIQERLRSHYEHEKALLEFYETIGQEIHTIAAHQSLSEVYNELVTKLGYSQE